MARRYMEWTTIKLFAPPCGHVSPRARSHRKLRRHAYAALGFRRRLPAGGIRAERGGLLSRSAGVRHHRLLWTPSHMSRREADLRDVPSRPAVAAHALSVATRIRFHSMQIRSMRLHHDQIHRRRTTKTDTRLLRGRPIHFVNA
eukprot:4217537-Pleurochrysis_carterae.AAC.1